MKHLRDILSLPILAANPGPCDLGRLDEILNAENEKCAEVVADLNRGVIAIALSGGIDSSLNLAMLRKAFPWRKIVAYTIGMNAKDDDVIHAKEVAERCNVTHHRIVMPSLEEVISASATVKELFCQKGLDRQVDGSVAVHLLFQELQKDGLKAIILHRGADELFGGGWSHRISIEKGNATARTIFDFLWASLEKNHLWPIEILSTVADVRVVYPYLRRSVVEEVARIEFSARTSRQESKIPLRDLAAKYDVPESVVNRPKRRMRQSVPPMPQPTE